MKKRVYSYHISLKVTTNVHWAITSVVRVIVYQFIRSVMQL